MFAAWQTEAIKRWVPLNRLPPNWNSYGSPRPTEYALSMALRLIKAIKLDDLPIPDVFPVPGGGIQFEWQCGPRQLELEVPSYGDGLEISFLKCQNGEPLTEGAVNSDPELTSLAAWLVS